ncbi:MAG: SPFH domain-containing protein [Chloroflexota bacterium]
MAVRNFSKIKEVVASWNNIQQLLRSGDKGHLVPVVIPKDKRGFGWAFWILFGFYIGITTFLTFPGGGTMFLGLVAIGFFSLIGAASLWRKAKVEIEEGTTGVYSRFGKIERTLAPGRHFLWWPWDKVEFIVDTSTEIPYTAPVLSSPTKENVPLKSIEFFLKFRIADPIMFVRNIGATNFDIVLSSAVQDAIRLRSRQLSTADAYDLRGSDVGAMQDILNQQMSRYGIKIIGANIPDVQLPDQYRDNLATKEQVAKELVAYEKKWELTRKQRSDTILMEIERAKKERDEKIIGVKMAGNQARKDVAKMLQQRQADAEKIRLEIEAEGKAELKSAENEARALSSLGKAYQDNQAVLHYELELRRLDVAEKLLQSAPRPVVVNSQEESGSALSTLLLAKFLPDLVDDNNGHNGHQAPPTFGQLQQSSTMK